MTLGAKLRWKAHVKKKREELGLKYKKMYWIMGRRSALSIHNKLLLYKYEGWNFNSGNYLFTTDTK